VSKKFFTLIYGDQIRTAPETKIVPAGSLSTLMDSEEILEQVKKDADKYRDEVIKENETIKENAFKDGYEEGFKQWADHVVKLEQEIEKVHQELQELAVPVALKAAKKIVGREIELDPEVIVNIVLDNIKAVAQHKKITIYVNKKDLDILEKNKPEIKKHFESLESLSIRERNDVQPGGCIIETEVGIINGQMEHRWTVLEKAFANLMSSKSPAKKE
jgi:type III secretion protein L